MNKGIIIFKRLQFLQFVLCISFQCIAQTPYYYTLGEEQGLPTKEIYQVKQDDKGFIWIGCDAGLFRYDGIRFKRYSYFNANGRSISELKFDLKGRLWCQNFTGQIFYVEGDSMKLYHDFSSELRIYPLYAPDNEGGIWIATEKYIEHFDSKGVSSAKIKSIDSKGDSAIWYDIEILNDGRVLATSYNLGVCEIEKKGNTYSVIKLEKREKSAGRTTIENLHEGVFILEEVVAGEKYKISRYLNGDLLHIRDIEAKMYVYKIAEDNKGKLWICTSDGVFDFKPEKILFDSKAFFKGDKISFLYNDRENNIWLSSLQNGIHVIPNLQMKVLEELNEISGDNYFSFICKKNEQSLLAGTYSGSVYEINNAGQPYEVFPKHGEEYRLVRKIMKYKQTYFVSRGTFNLSKESNQSTVKALKNIRDFVILNDTIYFTSSHIIGYFPIKDNFSDILPVVIYSKSARSVVCDSVNNRVYFAANDGVYQYQYGKLLPIEFDGKRISAVKLGFYKNLLWIATVNNGFLQFDGKNVTALEKVNKELRGSQIKTFKIENGVIWAATENALNKISAVKTEYYDLSDGLMAREINDIAFLNGDVYLATNSGIVAFNQNAVSVNPIRPEISITGIKLNDEIVDEGGLTDLNYHNHKLTFNFISPCYKARGNFKYKYRILGLDTSWTVVSALNNEIIFPSLPAGEYTFEVKAVNEDGFESVVSATVKFSIGLPFWQAWWFYVLVAASGAVIVLVISVVTIRNIRRKALIKNELINSQLTAIRAQMNPHFMYNTLNSIQDLILKSDIKNTNYYLSKFSSLMRMILEFSDNEKVLLSEETQMLQSYLELEKLRFGDDFNFSIEVDKNIDAERELIPSLIIQPFVENAIKHGLLHKKGQKELKLKFLKEVNKMIVIVEDNGVGRHRSVEIKKRSGLKHKSFASNAVQKRLELLNSGGNYIELEILDLSRNEESIGTKVVIKINGN